MPEITIAEIHASPEYILTQEVLAHDVPGLEKLLKQFIRGMMTAEEYAEQVILVVEGRRQFMAREEL